MTNIIITFFAYFIDKFFGEFKFITHPIIFIGNMISYFQKYYYKDEILRGVYLVLFMLLSVGFISLILQTFLGYLHPFIEILLSSIIASMFIAHKMLYDSVKEVLTSNNKQHSISMLVSRDTKDMSESDVYKASIETYAENLSDGVIAPMLYLLLFGLPGIILYKTVNTMDSMVGYRNNTYEKYGKTAAKLDDILNYIPSRITAVLIMLIAKEKDLFAFYNDGKNHESPNAGHPITAMALVLHIELGGDTSYFGKLKKKPAFGNGRKVITQNDVKKALDIFPV